MSIQIGEIDVAKQIIDNEFHIRRLYGIIDTIASKANVGLTKEEIVRIEEESLKFLQKKYPNSGVEIIRKEVPNASDD